jgi:hypothetical protein
MNGDQSGILAACFFRAATLLRPSSFRTPLSLPPSAANLLATLNDPADNFERPAATAT